MASAWAERKPCRGIGKKVWCYAKYALQTTCGSEGQDTKTRKRFLFFGIETSLWRVICYGKLRIARLADQLRDMTSALDESMTYFTGTTP